MRQNYFSIKKKEKNIKHRKMNQKSRLTTRAEEATASTNRKIV